MLQLRLAHRHQVIDYSPLYAAMAATPLARWQRPLAEAVQAALDRGHGSLVAWQTVLSDLPAISPASVDLNSGVRIGLAGDVSDDQGQRLEALLRLLHPWRKGPVELFGVVIDSEWRSDWKWQRLRPYIQPLAGRRVLDVGCGNGYYCLRMCGEGAALVIGVDPTWLYIAQFYALKRYLPEVNAHVLPLAGEALPAGMNAFDTVFSMGVLYHRRNPHDHLGELRGCLRPGGQLVLESLVIEGGAGEVLVPPGRYAKMRNVWHIPSVATLQTWLAQAGYVNIRVVDVTPTTIQEQRRTTWMHFESLADFLDPEDATLTTEGLPAPRRAMLVADRPG